MPLFNGIPDTALTPEDRGSVYDKYCYDLVTSSSKVKRKINMQEYDLQNLQISHGFGKYKGCTRTTLT